MSLSVVEAWGHQNGISGLTFLMEENRGGLQVIDDFAIFKKLSAWNKADKGKLTEIVIGCYVLDCYTGVDRKKVLNIVRSILSFGVPTSLQTSFK